MLCYRSNHASTLLKDGFLPRGPWFHTDDTEMAISLVAVLKSHGSVDCDALSKRFVRRFERDPDRGYGSMTRVQLREIMRGAKWQVMSASAFGGQGSMGNGSAMRVAPLGAYFAEDLTRLVHEAKKSSAVTHTHPEGLAGAVAIAAGAAAAWHLKNNPTAATRFFDEVLQLMPDSEVKRRIVLASQLPAQSPVKQVAATLGCGELVTAPDTVPFCIWVAAHRLGNFVGALSDTISVGGDCDTNAAIVGGIVALSTGLEGIPADWLKAREPIIF
jgi:ADP-ribosylglycohydrolase